MDKLSREIKEYSNTAVMLKVAELFKLRLQKARESNDASPAEDVLKNQGAIRELKWLLAHLT